MTEVAGRRRILVTGGSRGIGAAICEGFAQLGDVVAVHCGASLDAANALLASLPGSGHVVVQADLRDADAVQVMVDDAAAALGGIDVLVNTWLCVHSHGGSGLLGAAGLSWPMLPSPTPEAGGPSR